MAVAHASCLDCGAITMAITIIVDNVSALAETGNVGQWPIDLLVEMQGTKSS